MRRPLLLLGFLGVLAAAACQGPTAHDGPAVRLYVLTGTVQVTRSGASTAAIARGGELLFAGDRVATGPGGRALLDFRGTGLLRLDAGSAAVVVEPASNQVRLEHGQGWAEVAFRPGVTVEVAGHRLSGSRPGTEWAAVAGSGGATAAVFRGQVAAGSVTVDEGQSLTLGGGSPPAVARLTAAQRDDPWPVLNSVLDADASARGPAALGTGSLLPGEETSPQPALAVPPGDGADLVFTAGWQTGRVELLIVNPAGAVVDRAAGPPPLHLKEPSPMEGGWEFRLRRLDQPAAGPVQLESAWFVAVSLQAH